MHRIIYLLFISIALTYSCQQSDSPDNPPNIIFILTDDQRWDALGYAGNELAHTPEMDRLASEGIYFSHAMVTTPICAASRATILTGLYERTHRYDFRNREIRPEYMQTSYPVELRKAGYYTGFFGKFGVKYPEADTLFDVFESYDRNNKFKDRRGYFYKTLGEDTVHLTRYTGQMAMEFLDSIPGDRPFCLSLSFSAPHAHDGAAEQYFWQDASDPILANMAIPDPDLAADTWFDRLPESVREGFNRTRWYWRYDTQEKAQHSIKGYYRMIAGIDREITAIREKLESNGLDDNTIIILMGDNGMLLGERQLTGKWLMYEQSIRVPLIIYDPRNPQHRDIDQLAMNIDIPSTILDLAGCQIPESWQGKSLVPFLNSTSYDLKRDTALIEHLWNFEHIPPSEGLRTSDWKYFRYVNDQSIEELYHLSVDPLETVNLAGDPDHQARMETFRSHLARQIHQYRDLYVGIPDGLKVNDGAPSNNQNTTNRISSSVPTNAHPHYSWNVPEGAGEQLSYQILVSGSQENINRNIGELWNSGEVASGEHNRIVHAGQTLLPGKEYYWKVRIWDGLHRLSDYSKVMSFTISRSD